MARSILLARSLALVALAVAAGCATLPHVTLDAAPDQSAPYDTRAAYYKQHAANTFDNQRLVLHDGTNVYWPEDLRPAVDPASPTAKAIDRYEAAKQKLEPRDTWLTISGLTVIAGLVGVTAAVVPIMGVIRTYDDPRAFEGALAASAALGVGGGVATTVGLVGSMALPMVYASEQQQLDDSIRAVVTTYPQSLSDRTGIQPDANGRLVDLTTEAAPAQAPKTAEGRAL